MNERIRAAQIRLIGPDGEPCGVVTVPQALKKAEESNLDLVEIAPNANPPVCRIMDFGKYLYSLDKKEKEAKKKQKSYDLKEIKISSKIENHDFQTKLRYAKKFLSRGDKVKLTMWFRGREMAHVDLGERVIQRFVSEIEEYGSVEKNFGFERRSISLILAPRPQKEKRAKETELKIESDKAKENPIEDPHEAQSQKIETEDQKGGQEAV